MQWELKKFDDLTGREVYEILRLRSEVFVLEQECAYQDVDGKDLVSYHLFAKDGDEVIANVRLLPKGVSYEEPSIGRVVVKKEYRGTGLAQEILKRAIEEIGNLFGETEIRISAQAYLLNYYSSAGFETVSEIYLEDGIEHREMLYKK